MSELLKFEIDQGVATITLNRPEKLNAFTDDMLEKWLAALEECRTSPEVRGIVMIGVGRAFTTRPRHGDLRAHGAGQQGVPGRRADAGHLRVRSRVAEGAPLAAQLTKRVMRFGRDEDLAKAKEIVAANLPIVRTSENHMEAVNAFREKRPPQFNGRKGQEARIG